ncbi:MAG: hypothetical protein ACODAE_10870, partial [Gemmatimonadota bacterium]
MGEVHGRMLPGATASTYVTNGVTVHVARSLPIHIRYEAEWGDPDETGLPIVRFFYRDRWLNTWAVGAKAHLDGMLDRALSGRVRLRVHVSRLPGEYVDGSMYAEPLAHPKQMLFLGPMRHRPSRPYGPDEGPQVAIDALLRYLYLDPEKAAERLI